MKSLFVSGGVAFLISLIGTPLLIGWLRTHGIGQQIREGGPEGHFTKAGTPTMGGIAIVAAAFAGYVAGHFARVGAVFTYGGMLVMGVVVAAGIVGFLDDVIKFRQQRDIATNKRSSYGLNKRTKLGGQVLVAVVFGLLAVTIAKANTH